MIIRKVDSDNDWRFGKGKNDYAQAETAIEQNLKSRIQSWVGDCFFALQDGVDWRARLDVGQEDDLVEEIRGIILQSFGIVGVNSVAVSFNSAARSISVSYSAETIYSTSFQAVIQNSFGVVS